MLNKHKENEGIELAPVFFNSTTKTVINFKYMFEKFCIESIIGLIKDLIWQLNQSLDEKCLNTELFLVHIFLYLDQK